MTNVEKCCFINEDTGLPCIKVAECWIIAMDESGGDQSTYTCKDHFSQMRCEGEPAFDLNTGQELE